MSPLRVRSLRVFLAEDSPAVRRQLAELLAEIPGTHVVGEAASGRETLEGVQREAPDLLLLDLRMPRGDGFHVLRRLQRGRPITLVLTNSADSRTRARCLELGALRVFDKSTEFEEMLEYIRHLEAPS